jgi:hypothetical protein
MTRTVGVLGVAALLAALAVASALAAFADAAEVTRRETQGEFSIELFNPCTGEEVRYDLTVKGFTIVVTNDQGEPLLQKIHLRTTGTGTGLTSGNTYRFHDVLNDERHRPLPTTRTQSLKIIDPGTGEPLILRVVFHISPSGKVTVDTIKTLCP